MGTTFMDNFFANNSQKQILNRIFSLNLNLLCILDIQGQFLKVNKAWEKIFGYGTDELISANFIDFTHSGDRDATAFIFREMLKTSHRLTFSNRFRAKDGDYRYIDWEFNHHDGYCYVAGTDITNSKLPETDLHAMIRHHHREHYPLPMFEPIPVSQSILIVDDSPFNTKVLENALKEEYVLAITHSGEEALDYLRLNHPPDLILLDIVLPDIDGYEICRRLNRDPNTKDIPIFFLTSLTETRDIEYGLSLGAIDYITKPFSIPVIKAKIRNHLVKKHDYDNLKISNDIDQLTQIGNRRYFDEKFEIEVKRAQITKSLLSILLVDIDHFKLYNDTYGHLEGDRCLKTVATTLSGLIRNNQDYVARWGGEEFVCLLPDTDSQEAQELAERLRLAILSLAIPHAASPVEDVITISIGVVTSDRNNSDSFDILLERADEALYQAKKSGRNQYSVWCEDIVTIGACI
jgi:diguanylate cyclase (GGDEF)-like protein/PAS domain S-box-containing protein